VLIDEASIGRKIKEARRLKGYTLQAVADEIGLTKGYLSKVENSSKAAPVSTLLRIADVLAIPPAELFEEVVKSARLSVVRKNDRVRVDRGQKEFGYAYESLYCGMNPRQMQPYLLTIPGKTAVTALQHPGEELLYVVKGQMVFHYGEEEHELEEGDSVFFDASVAHWGEVRGAEEVECIMVIESQSNLNARAL